MRLPLPRSRYSRARSGAFRIVFLAVVLATMIGCGGVTPGVSRRATLAARRHVLVVPKAGEHAKSVDDSGSALDGDALDLPLCERLCAGVVTPGERIVGCFFTAWVDDDLLTRLRARGELLDCAIARADSFGAPSNANQTALTLAWADAL